MSGRSTSSQDVDGSTPRWVPRLGDLARDTATGAVGVIVDVPGEGVYSYHLRPPRGGAEWTAPRDGSTLRRADDAPSDAPGRSG